MPSSSAFSLLSPPILHPHTLLPSPPYISALATMDSSRGPYSGRYAHETLSSSDLYHQGTNHPMAAGHPGGFSNRAFTDEQARSNQPVYQPPAIPRLPQSSALSPDQANRGGSLAQGTAPDPIPKSRYPSNNYSGGDYSWQSSAGPTYPPTSYYNEQGGYSTNMASQSQYVEEPLPLSSHDQSYASSSGYQIPSPSYPTTTVQHSLPYEARSHPPMYPAPLAPHASSTVTKHIPIPTTHASNSTSYPQETLNHRASRWTGPDLAQPVSAPASTSSSSSGHQAPIPIKHQHQHQHHHQQYQHHHQDVIDPPRSAARVLTQGPSDPAPSSSYGNQNYIFPEDVVPPNVDMRGQSPTEEYALQHRMRRPDFNEYSDQNYRNPPPPEPSPPTHYRSYDEYHPPVSPYGYTPSHSSHSPSASYTYPQSMQPTGAHGLGPSSPRKSNLDEAEMVQYGAPPVKPKRRRADAAQLRVLNEVYQRTAFPSTEERTQLGQRLNMSPRQVQIWFQNRRQNARGRANSSSQPPQVPASPGSSSTGPPSVSLTPSVQSFSISSSLTHVNHRTKREDHGDDLP